MLKLVQIELLGFKSFPHKTVVDLDAGATCIVGPNGSGKSNLADAIHFAFGSQSGRELRAHKLAGLIFAGTDQLRPLNLASVTLHFERTAHEMVSAEDSLAGLAALASDELDLPEIALASQPIGSQLGDSDGFKGTELTRHLGMHTAREYDRTPAIVKELTDLEPGQRISLTRRVFRDGTGGYFINDQVVRLKDVDALFNRYNLGRSAVYSISQGEVEKKILETPQELRTWLAEATGVALLLQQKQRAQNKLKRTKQNLERLEDIRTNTRELVEDLAGQRHRAEEHIRLSSQLRAVELNEIRREVEFAQRQQESAAKALAELAELLDSQRGERERIQGEYRQNQQARKDLEAQLEQGETKLTAQRDELARLRQESAVSERAAADDDEAIEQARLDAEAIAEELAQAEQELAANAQQAKALQQELDEARRHEEETRARLKEAQRRENEISASQAELSNRGFELAQQEAALANRLESMTQTKKQLEAQSGERRAQVEGARGRLEAGVAELAEHQRQAEELALTVGTKRDELERQQEELAQLAGQISAADAASGEARDRVAHLNSRRRTIAELAEESDDPESGPAQLMASTALAGKLTRVTEVTFADELRPAFTRLLAHLGDALAGGVEMRPAALDVLRGAGAEALVLSGQPARELHPDSLWRKLTAPAAVVAALTAVLGDVALADDLAGAQALLNEHAALDAAVLRDGSALIGRGYAYLGAPSPERALKVARHSDLAHLDTQIAKAQRELVLAEDTLADLRAQQAQGQWDRDEMGSRLAAAEERLRQALLLSDRLLKSVEERRAEHELLSHQLKQLEGDSSRLETDRPEVELRLAELKAERERNQQLTEQLAGERQAAVTALEEARGLHAKAATARELAEQRGLHLKQAGLDLAERASNQRTRRARITERITALEDEREGNLAAAEAARLRADEIDAELAQAGSGLDRLRLKRVELHDSAERLTSETARLAAEISRLEQDDVAQNAVRDRALERVTEWLTVLTERYSLTLSELLSDPAVTAPPPGAEIDASEAGRGKLREEKARLSQGLEELGVVNLLAIEQHQEHSQRLAFLDAQAAELERAMSDLDQLVGDLDSTTEKRYRSNLRQIEQRFNEAYLKLFGSGWARLRFEDPEAIIDSGVEVEVQLPAGRRHSLRSLSGGQRSLIFLALFFAVHSVRSPGFCILDEADAALDDANVERFVKLIRNVSRGEQFIVITHNKSTMETADKLIGVVGRPKGVSNLLSVDLKEARKLVDRTVA